jgi:toxin YoeB
MRLLFSNSAKASFDVYKSDNPELSDRIKTILKDIVAHPTEGEGTPVALAGEYAGYWTRSFAPDGLIVYTFDSESVKIISIGVSESALAQIKLVAYTEAEEKAVMEQMAANRGKDDEPKVGIFWYNRATNQLYGVVSHRVSDYTRANASDGRITCSEMHEDVWKKEFRKQKYQYGGQGPFVGAYQDKPRGRVFYHIDNGTFEVAVGKWIEEYPQAYEEILKEFNLPPDKTTAKYAYHWDIGQSWR